MAICQFFLRGTCKFGDQCRNEHPQNPQGNRPSQTPFGGSTWTSTNMPKTIPYSLETITKDFDVRGDRPSWPLSSYGPAKHEKNLLPSLDESFEELRVKAVTAARNGNINEYFRYEQNAFAHAEKVFANVRNDTKSAFEAAKRQSLGTDAPSGLSVFPKSGSGSVFGARDTSSFGQPSTFGVQGSNSTTVVGQPQVTSTFRTPAFGAPAFGQTPSASGQPPVAKPSFGGADANNGGFSAFAGPVPSAFATAATTSTVGPVFGQSAFGGAQPAQSPLAALNSTSTSAFGRPSTFGSTSGTAFGQTSPFGATNNTTSAFGQPTSAPASVFGQAPITSSSSPTAPAFGQSMPAFGQPTPPTSAFGRPVATTAFGQPTAQTSSFGSPMAPHRSAFNQSVSPTIVPKPQAMSAPPDFAHVKLAYKPGLDPYDALLPPNYSSLLPDDVRAAFAAPRFTWDNVPDWIPPLDMR